MNFFQISIPVEDEFEKEYSKTSNPHYPLFDHQMNAVKKSKEILKKEFNNNLILHMPTGSGKTRTCMNIISDYLRENKGIVVWLANNEELCEQAFDEFGKAWVNLGDREVGMFKLWGAGNGVLHGNELLTYQEFIDLNRRNIDSWFAKTNSIIKNITIFYLI